MAKFFTKKVCLITLSVVIALSGIIWAIVMNIKPKFRSGITEIPAANYVSGNGSGSVMVDNYLYFAGGIMTTSEIKYGDNEYYANAKMPDSGIFRVKIGADSDPVLTYVYDNTYTNEETGEKGEYQPEDDAYNTVVSSITDWDNIGKKGNGVEAVVPKIVGHDKTAMWVFGSYLIYSSPHNRLDNRGKLMSSYLDFFRVDLNGNNNTLLYTTESTDLTASNYTVWADSKDNIYLIIYETDNGKEKPETKIKKINVQTKQVSVIDSKVTNVVLPSATQYKNGSANEGLDKVYGGVMGYVYYTKTRDDSSIKGNLMYRCAINGGEPEIIAQDGNDIKGTNFTPLTVSTLTNGGGQFVYSIEVSYYSNGSKTVSDPKEYCVMTNQNYQNYQYQEPTVNANSTPFAGKSVAIYANGYCTLDNYLYHYNLDESDIEHPQIVLDVDNNGAKKYLSGTVNAVLAVMGNTIYVQSGNSVYIVSNGDVKEISIGSNSSSDETTEEKSEDTEKVSALPIAILFQPQSNQGDPMIFVGNSTDIRLYSFDKTYKYLRIKQS